MIELPADVQTRIDQILIELEIAVGAEEQQPDDATIDDGPHATIFRVRTKAARVQAIVLDRVTRIVAVIRALPWTVADRRERVEFYQRQLITKYALERSRFLETVRATPEWQALLRASLHTSGTTTTQQYLRARMDEALWGAGDLAAATVGHKRLPAGVNQRTIEALLGKHPPTMSRTTQDVLQDTLTGKLGYPVKIPVVRKPRKRIGKNSARRR